LVNFLIDRDVAGRDDCDDRMLVDFLTDVYSRARAFNLAALPWSIFWPMLIDPPVDVMVALDCWSIFWPMLTSPPAVMITVDCWSIF
jgi:hypothetical protein